VVTYQERNVAIEARDQAIRERNRALVALFQDLNLDVGAGQNAGSLCFSSGPGCVLGRTIGGVTGPPGTLVPLGALDTSTWIGRVNDQQQINLSAGKPASNVFVAAIESGKGRVIAYAHDGMIRDAMQRNCYGNDDLQCVKSWPNKGVADNLTFVDNALRWAMRPTPADCPAGKITIAIYEGWVKADETTEIAGMAKQRGWTYSAIVPTADAGHLSSQLHCVNALIWGNPWTGGPDAQLAAVVTYVRNGGGLLLGGLGWSWAQYNNKTPFEDYPAGRLAAAFGFGFTNDAFEVGATMRLQPPPARPSLNAPRFDG
jgi:hypothetical protein